MWCRSYFWFTLVNQAGQLNKIGSHTIKYFIVTSTNNLMLVKITFYYNRFDLLIVKIKATVLYYMMPWTNTKIHEEKSNKMQQCIKILLFQFLWSSTCFGRHAAHHQEPKTALAATGFSYVEGCWACSWWTLSSTLCLITSTNYTSNSLPRMQNQWLPVQF